MIFQTYTPCVESVLTQKFSFTVQLHNGSLAFVISEDGIPSLYSGFLDSGWSYHSLCFTSLHASDDNYLFLYPVLLIIVSISCNHVACILYSHVRWMQDDMEIKTAADRNSDTTDPVDLIVTFDNVKYCGVVL
jgi:hypothetical protein